MLVHEDTTGNATMLVYESIFGGVTVRMPCSVWEYYWSCGHDTVIYENTVGGVTII